MSRPRAQRNGVLVQAGAANGNVYGFRSRIFEEGFFV